MEFDLWAIVCHPLFQSIYRAKHRGVIFPGPRLLRLQLWKIMLIMDHQSDMYLKLVFSLSMFRRNPYAFIHPLAFARNQKYYEKQHNHFSWGVYRWCRIIRPLLGLILRSMSTSQRSLGFFKFEKVHTRQFMVGKYKETACTESKNP